MIQPDIGQVLMGRYIHDTFKDTAEMKWTYMTVLCQLMKGNILIKMTKDILFSIFNRTPNEIALANH